MFSNFLWASSSWQRDLNLSMTRERLSFNEHDGIRYVKRREIKVNSIQQH